jgi:hypothetical protein
MWTVEHTLVDEDKDRQERRASHSAFETLQQHRQRFLGKRFALEKNHWNHMQSPINWEHPSEDGDEAFDFDIHTAVYPRMNNFAGTSNLPLEVAPFGMFKHILEYSRIMRSVSLNTGSVGALRKRMQMTQRLCL